MDALQVLPVEIWDSEILSLLDLPDLLRFRGACHATLRMVADRLVHDARREIRAFVEPLQKGILPTYPIRCRSVVADRLVHDARREIRAFVEPLLKGILPTYPIRCRSGACVHRFLWMWERATFRKWGRVLDRLGIADGLRTLSTGVCGRCAFAAMDVPVDCWQPGVPEHHQWTPHPRSLDLYVEWWDGRSREVSHHFLRLTSAAEATVSSRGVFEVEHWWRLWRALERERRGKKLRFSASSNFFNWEWILSRCFARRTEDGRRLPFDAEACRLLLGDVVDPPRRTYAPGAFAYCDTLKMLRAAEELGVSRDLVSFVAAHLRDFLRAVRRGHSDANFERFVLTFHHNDALMELVLEGARSVERERQYLLLLVEAGRGRFVEGWLRRRHGAFHRMQWELANSLLERATRFQPDFFFLVDYLRETVFIDRPVSKKRRAPPPKGAKRRKTAAASIGTT